MPSIRRGQADTDTDKPYMSRSVSNRALLNQGASGTPSVDETETCQQ